jgi:hypothetical protein
LSLWPGILVEEVEEERAPEPREVETEPPTSRLWWGWSIVLAAATATPRLAYLFLFTDPENPGVRRYDDVWHHWQIAYLTKEIGLQAPDGPRLWDLKGLEYFWGILHPLLMAAVFYATGSIDIVLNRLVSVVFGVAVVLLVFHLCRRYWGTQVGLAAALAAITLPTSVMNDASGMLEPIGVFLCLLGVWAWSRDDGLWAGIAFGLATMARAEAWIFSVGLVAAAFLGRPRTRQLWWLLAGFGGVMLLYMKVLQDHTGNAIYPLWWNFFANAAGKWEFTAVNAGQASVRPVLGVLLVASSIGLAWSLWRRPASYMLLTFGFGYWVFVAGMLGFTAYLASWVWWMPITRVFAFPYVFAGILFAVALLWWAPRRFGKRVIPWSWGALAVTLVACQLAWIPIAKVFGPSELDWRAVKAESVALGGWYNASPYAGHSIALPPDRPEITYALARFGGVEGKHLVSEMYGPFAYVRAGYRFEDHQSTVNTLLECWFTDTDIRLIAIAPNDQNLLLAVQLNPGWFVRVGSMADAGWIVDGVSAPKPSAADCEAARSASR